ncbi:unnamed protein product [Ectocarpus sp. 4 AP-2014]
MAPFRVFSGSHRAPCSHFHLFQIVGARCCFPFTVSLSCLLILRLTRSSHSARSRGTFRAFTHVTLFRVSLSFLCRIPICRRLLHQQQPDPPSHMSHSSFLSIPVFGSVKLTPPVFPLSLARSKSLLALISAPHPPHIHASLLAAPLTGL